MAFCYIRRSSGGEIMLGFTKFALGVVFLFSVFSCSKPDSNPPAPAGVVGVEPTDIAGQPGDCKEFIKTIPADYFHEWIKVPENPFEPEGRKIQVFYYGPKTLNENVVIFYNGGPGSNSHGTKNSFDSDLAKHQLQQKISFIYVDQRGTGCSSGYPNKRTEEDVLRARWYGSTGIVYDSEAIRQKLLGAKKWKIFGQSYGAFIVHRYVSLFPGSIDSAYAHANTINADAEQRMYDRIYSQYRVLNMYFDVYPEDKAKLAALKNYLTLTKCFTTEFIGEVCGHELLAGSIFTLGFSNYWPYLHSNISEIVKANEDKFTIDDEKIKKMITQLMDYEESDMGLAGAVIAYFDRNVSGGYETCANVYRKLAEAQISEDQLLLNECMPSIQSKYSTSALNQKIKEIIGSKTDHLKIENFKEGLLKMKAKSFYLYSGEKDCFVPKESFNEELGYVGALLNYTNFMDSGHEGYRSEKQVWDDLIK
jgi:pimeloyl-ACP methyl ester carboxylesterase